MEEPGATKSRKAYACTAEEPRKKRRRRCFTAEATAGRTESASAMFHCDPLHMLTFLRHNRCLCDGVMKGTSGEAISIHRVILATISPFFKALFVNSIGSDRPIYTDITLQGIQGKTLGTIIEFAYTGTCNITTGNVQELMTAADQMDVTQLIEKCGQFITQHINIDNCFSVARFARWYLFKQLESSAWRFAMLNFPTVIEKSAELSQLSSDELIHYLSDDMLNARNEQNVFEVIITWIQKDNTNRRARLHDLLSCIRFGLTHHSFVANYVWNHKQIVRNRKARTLLLEARKLLVNKEVCACSDGEDALFKARLTRPRLPTHTLVAVGGWSAGSPVTLVEVYDTRANSWLLLPDNEHNPRAYHGMEVLDNKIYVIGGFNSTHNLNSVRCFDAITRQWHERACMNTERCFVSTCVLHGLIYAIGGYDGSTRLNTCERYDPQTNQWHALPSMQQRRSDAAAACIDGKVYVAGGFDGYRVFNSVEVFDPQLGTWSYAPSMRSVRSGLSLVSVHDHLVAIGGFNGVRRLRTVEMLHVARQSSWYAAASMRMPRSNLACAVIEDVDETRPEKKEASERKHAELYAIGGFNGVATVAEVERYDWKENRWSSVVSMSVNRSALAACVLHQLPNVRYYSLQARHHESSQC